MSDLVRNPQGHVAQTIRNAGESQVCTSIIVAAELRYGAAKKQSPRLTSQLQAVLGALEILPFESPADDTYGLLRARLERAGRVIGAHFLGAVRRRETGRTGSGQGKRSAAHRCSRRTACNSLMVECSDPIQSGVGRSQRAACITSYGSSRRRKHFARTRTKKQTAASGAHVHLQRIRTNRDHSVGFGCTHSKRSKRE